MQNIIKEYLAQAKVGRKQSYKNLAVYIFGTGRHAAKGSGEVMGWLYSHDTPPIPKTTNR